MTTGGAWKRDGNILIFAASQLPDFRICAHNKNLLLSIAEIRNPSEEISEIERRIGMGDNILIDSGAYTIASEHAKREGIELHQAFTMKPEKLKGFSELLEKYLSILMRLRDSVWGYIELDIGGQSEKKRMRKILESKGLAPIPVFHPISDELSYFDELAEQYDRIAVGNLVARDPLARNQTLAWLQQKKEQYPHLWIHALGVSPVPSLFSLPMDSADASTWASAILWGQAIETACFDRIGELSHDWIYSRDIDPDDPGKGLYRYRRYLGWKLTVQETMLNHQLRRIQELGLRK